MLSVEIILHADCMLCSILPSLRPRSLKNTSSGTGAPDNLILETCMNTYAHIFVILYVDHIYLKIKN